MRWFVLTLLIYSIVLTDTVDPVDSGITFLNVGVGDATIVRVDEKVIFIDAGPSDSILYNIDNLPKKIDLLVITHQHEDHISGARYLLERFDVREVIMPRLCDVDPIDVLYPSGAETRKTAITLLDNNDLIEYQYPLPNSMLDEKVKLKLLLPRYGDSVTDECIRVTDTHQVNDNSIVTEILSPDVKILLMGDTEKEGEFALLENQSALNVIADYQILKAGHHCSNTSSGEKFLRYVDPDILVCSTGEHNSYGHPSREVLDRADSLGIKIHLTYRDGDLFVPF